MATYLINAIASIPSNPQDDDVIRFETPITTGIPSTIKKADGTTTEAAIGVGYEYRYFASQSAWLKIGGDPIITTPLRSATLADMSEASTMILGGVHTDTPAGRIRKFGLKVLHQLLQSVAPTQLNITYDVIYKNDSGVPAGNGAGGTQNLDIKSGTTRYDFSDYTFFIAFFLRGTVPSIKPSRVYYGSTLFLGPDFLDKNRSYGYHNGNRSTWIWKTSNTSFRIHRTHTSGSKLFAMHGYKTPVSIGTP